MEPSGVGKSTLADELSLRLADRRCVIRSTTDSFHRPKAERYKRGATSAEGYYRDSHDLLAIERQLLKPFAAGVARVCVGTFDERSDTPAVSWAEVDDEAVLIFDGLFLQRPELRPHWDLTVYLRADDRRAAAWESYLLSGLPVDGAERARELQQRRDRSRRPRYHEGWQLYFDEVDPAASADFVINNEDFGQPSVVATRGP